MRQVDAAHHLTFHAEHGKIGQPVFNNDPCEAVDGATKPYEIKNDRSLFLAGTYNMVFSDIMVHFNEAKKSFLRVISLRN